MLAIYTIQSRMLIF